MKITQKQIDRFWSKVDKKGEDECWEWKASKRRGYGQISFNYKNYSTHRISWVLTYGEIPEGLFVCHKCDSPGCSRPDHLFLGTHQDNMDDMYKKGRYSDRKGIKSNFFNRNQNGENNKNSKLTEQQVIEIRQKYIPWKYTQQMLADEYGVGRENIGDIINRRNWRSI